MSVWQGPWRVGVVLGLLVAGMVRPAPAGEIAGFRSALFGMSESQVLWAIESDFGIEASEVKRTLHPLQKTRVLTITVNEIVAGTGATRIAYVFGFKSRTMIQVNLLWGEPVEPNPNVAKLVKAARLMTFRLALQRLRQDDGVANSVLPDGSVLVFRSANNRGGLVQVRLKGRRQERAGGGGEAGGKRDSWLKVSFAENTVSPDIFRIEPGQF